MLEQLGERIARFRNARGLTQQELADRIAASRTAISHFEMDLALPSERTIVLLAGIFRCEPHELVAGTYYPAAKAERLPAVAARYTEVEKELCVLDHDITRLLEQPAGCSSGQAAALRSHWSERLLALHPTAPQHERRLIEAGLQRLRVALDRL